jgi:Cytochrome C biogenesis protein
MRKLAEILLLCAAVALLMRADSANERFTKLGRKIMCTCGSCTYLLLECNHVGCPNSTRMIRELKALTGDKSEFHGHPGASADAKTSLEQNISLETDDEKVLDWFRSRWGVTAVVVPAKHGLELWAWIMPPAALGLGLLLVIIVVRKWRLHAAGASPANANLDPHLEALRARARRETEI